MTKKEAARHFESLAMKRENIITALVEAAGLKWTPEVKMPSAFGSGYWVRYAYISPEYVARHIRYSEPQPALRHRYHSYTVFTWEEFVAKVPPMEVMQEFAKLKEAVNV